MPETVDPRSSNFDEFNKIFTSLSEEKQEALVWLLENLPLIDRIAKASTLSQEEIAAFLNDKHAPWDYRLKMLLLYQKFQQEQAGQPDI